MVQFEKKNNNLIQNQQPKVDNINTNNNNRTLIIGFSNCGKIYLMNYFILRKQEPFFIITKSLNQYPNTKAQTSDEIQPFETYRNSTAVFDDMLLTKQESNIGLFFTRGRHNNIDMYYISQRYFHLPKNTLCDNSNMIILFKQTLRDIILLFHNIAGFFMNLEDGKQLCCKAWGNDYEFLQIDRLAKKREGRYTIINCNKIIYIQNALPKHHLFNKINVVYN